MANTDAPWEKLVTPTGFLCMGVLGTAFFKVKGGRRLSVSLTHIRTHMLGTK